MSVRRDVSCVNSTGNFPGRRCKSHTDGGNGRGGCRACSTPLNPCPVDGWFSVKNIPDSWHLSFGVFSLRTINQMVGGVKINHLTVGAMPLIDNSIVGHNLYTPLISLICSVHQFHNHHVQFTCAHLCNSHTHADIHTLLNKHVAFILFLWHLSEPRWSILIANHRLFPSLASSVIRCITRWWLTPLLHSAIVVAVNVNSQHPTMASIGPSNNTGNLLIALST